MTTAHENPVSPPVPLSWGAARALLFTMDAESAHELTLSVMSRYATVCSGSPRWAQAGAPVSKAGLTFAHPVGLAAGLDKNARAVLAWQRLGFAFIEIGTVTWHAQPGNPKPRLFRLKDQGALFNRMGFNNEGAEVAAGRLEKLRAGGRLTVPLGVNIGKSKITPNEEAAAEYAKTFSRLAPFADYVVVNVSSPNTPGLRDLQNTEALFTLVDAVMSAHAKLAVAPPVLVKLAPDLSDEDTLACAGGALARGVAGLILSNTTIDKSVVKNAPDGGGGLSGAPVFSRSTAQLAAVRAHVGPDAFLIGSGGIMNAQSARKKMSAGADLVQVYSGFIYGGPSFVRQLATQLR